MVPTERGLLDDVIKAPADDWPRLVYADWCEDSGQPERAEFIRLQVKTGSVLHLAGDVWLEPTGSREADLLAVHQPWWTPCDPGRICWVWQRGFIWSVDCPLAEWVRHGPAIAATHPIQGLGIDLHDRQDGFPPTCPLGMVPRDTPALGFHGSHVAVDPRALPPGMPAATITHMTHCISQEAMRKAVEAIRLPGRSVHSLGHIRQANDDGWEHGMRAGLIRWAWENGRLGMKTWHERAVGAGLMPSCEMDALAMMEEAAHAG
jgi:uncharacterized protein (TIGR02996 family)